MKGIRMLLCVMIGLMIGSIIGVFIVNCSHCNRKQQTSNTETTNEETVEQITTKDDSTQEPVHEDEIATANDAQSIIVSDAEQPSMLTRSLSISRIQYKQLADIGCKQLLVVSGEGRTAQISLYVCDEKGLWSDTGLTTSGFVGANGVSRDSYEGSKMTPAGAFPIGDAFYIDEQPDTNLSSFQITNNTYWVDDPESEDYNCLVELSGEKTWNSAEHMIEYSSAYKYGFVVNFNMNPVTPGKGSAIFFHIGDHETLGCIATSEEMVLAYLAALDAEQNPYILIQ